MDTIHETVNVALQRNGYSIHIGESILWQISERFSQHFQSRHAVVISDENVASHYLESVTGSLNTVSDRVDSIVVPAGEPSKSIECATDLWRKMMSLNADRSSTIIALGGGVVGDLAGFIAATFMRGIPLIQVPTSLLAQVDSSVGGKTGINLPDGKNLVGSFLQPAFVLISTSTLRTLDDSNFIAGLAEVVKYGVIMDEAFFAWLEENALKIARRDEATLSKLIAWCCRCKAQIVEEDEKETTGRRAILNYGHTFGHAIESVFGYGSYLHGEAISIGMTCAAQLAVQMNLIPAEIAARQLALLQALSLPVSCPSEKHDQLLTAMKKDKKSSGGSVKLILPKRIGEAVLVDWPGDSQVMAALNV